MTLRVVLCTSPPEQAADLAPAQQFRFDWAEHRPGPVEVYEAWLRHHVARFVGLVEGAAAAGVAALERFGDEIPGERVGVILTGGWVSRNDLLRALAMSPE